MLCMCRYDRRKAQTFSFILLLHVPGCLDQDCKCRNCKLGAIRCLDVACCHLPLGCKCLDLKGNCCPGGFGLRCRQISLQCGTCLSCGTLGCESFCFSFWALLCTLICGSFCVVLCVSLRSLQGKPWCISLCAMFGLCLVQTKLLCSTRSSIILSVGFVQAQWLCRHVSHVQTHLHQVLCSVTMVYKFYSFASSLVQHWG